MQTLGQRYVQHEAQSQCIFSNAFSSAPKAVI
jgi:hypothetical protein